MLQFLASPTLLEIVNIWASNNICNLSGIGECACESVYVKVCTTGGWETIKGQWISNSVFKKKIKMSLESQMFFSLDLALRLQQIVLLSAIGGITTIRKLEFTYLIHQAHVAMSSFCFVFDHSYYPNWISVHLKDIINLEEQHPWVQKTLNRFSSMPLDHAHWQFNCNI